MAKRYNDEHNLERENQNVSADASAEQDVELTPDLEVKAKPVEDPASLIEKLQAQIVDSGKELAEMKDRYLRALADNENARKRMRQQSEETVRLQRENFMRELLPVVDNLERALDAARGGGNGKPIVEGVEMVLRSLLDLLKAQGVTQLISVGQPFDPQRHEAVDQIVSSQHPANTVVNEFHRGYQIGERVLRPARVTVAKGSEQEDGEGGNGNCGNGVETA
jgi:molecular chaperone GrpE